jgi:hypothetical protein
MRAAARILIILVLNILFFSCHEVYYPEGLDTDDKILVVEGYIDNSPGPYTVKLSWATLFNENEYEAVPDAIVTILDNYGNSELLTEHYNGHYISTDGIKGIPGREYTLRVELEDGSVYESEPTLMQTANEIYTLYAEPGTKEVETRNYSGDYKIEKSLGLFVYADLKADSNIQRFFRFNSKFVVQRKYYRIYSTQSVPRFLWWTGTLNEGINIKSTFINNTENALKKHYIGFLPYIFDLNSQSDTNTAIYPAGWGVVSSVFSITKNSYEFYNSILIQIDAEDRIFDPIPSQITGNMYCISDTTRQVFGLFEVASRNIKNTGFYWKHGHKNITVIDLQEYYPPKGSGMKEFDPPDFWITFF